MQLYLINTGQYPRPPINQGLQRLLRKVTNPNPPTSLSYQRLHHLPRLDKSRTLLNSQIRLAAVSFYANRVRPVHEEDVDVLESQGVQGVLEGGRGRVVPLAPEFCDERDF